LHLLVASPRILACPPRGSLILISENQMYANFHEKALFVKPTWRLLAVER
jgi:hypothetical protein